MSRELKIRLTDEQCDALAAEAKRNRLSYFDHCRLKLLAGISPELRIDRPGAPVELGAVPAEKPQMAATKQATAQPDRLDRLEAMILQMGEAIAQIANPQHIIDEEPPMAEDPTIDVDDVVNGAVADIANRPVIEPQPQMQMGVRHMGTRRPMPFSVGAQPHHLRQV